MELKRVNYENDWTLEIIFQCNKTVLEICIIMYQDFYPYYNIS